MELAIGVGGLLLGFLAIVLVFVYPVLNPKIEGYWEKRAEARLRKDRRFRERVEALAQDRMSLALYMVRGGVILVCLVAVQIALLALMIFGVSQDQDVSVWYVLYAAMPAAAALWFMHKVTQLYSAVARENRNKALMNREQQAEAVAAELEAALGKLESAVERAEARAEQEWPERAASPIERIAEQKRGEFGSADQGPR